MPYPSTPEDIHAALLAPFPLASLGALPAATYENRAIPAFYIDARDVMDRLDAVFGPGGWQTDFETHFEKKLVVCRLKVQIQNEWVVKTDCGGESEQKNEGDRHKAAFSDALKRAAVHLGIGRYLYQIPEQWLEFDPQKKRFVGTPRPPDAFLPEADRKVKGKPATAHAPGQDLNVAAAWAEKFLASLKAAATAASLTKAVAEIKNAGVWELFSDVQRQDIIDAQAAAKVRVEALQEART